VQESGYAAGPIKAIWGSQLVDGGGMLLRRTGDGKESIYAPDAYE
jgi:hypothetical protein